jgi:SAM-dependent methyltransferase
MGRRINDGVVGRGSRFLRGLRSFLPLPAWWIIQRHLDPAGRSLLDIGCGRGGPIELIRRRRRLFLVGADIFLPYLLHCQAAKVYDHLVCCDVRYLPFTPKSFDVVLCTEVLEHLERVDALVLLKSMEAIARRQVIISTPVGQCEQQAYDGNPHQAHHSSWMPQDFRRLGYTVRGSGVRGMAGLISKETSPLPEWLRLLANAIWILSTPFSYYFPRIGGTTVCVMNVRGQRWKNARGELVSASRAK